VAARRRRPPTALLFNGGVFKADGAAEADAGKWSGKLGDSGVRELLGQRPRSGSGAWAAYYGLVRRGKGVRIGRCGNGRTTSASRRRCRRCRARSAIKALCVVPFGHGGGDESDVPGQEFGLDRRRAGRFPLPQLDGRGEATRSARSLRSWRTDRGIAADLNDAGGDHQPEQGQTVPCICIAGDGGRHAGIVVPEPGNKKRWKLEFNVRERSE